MMTEKSSLTERLISVLIHRLYDAEYTITPDDCKRIGFVIQAFLTRSPAPDIKKPEARKYLAGMIGPIVCSTPVQQNNFPALFEKAYSDMSSEDLLAIKKEPTGAVDNKEKKKPYFNKVTIGIGMVTLILAVILYVYYIDPWKQTEVTDPQPQDSAVVTLDSTVTVPDSTATRDTIWKAAYKPLVKAAESPVSFEPDMLKLLVAAGIIGILIGRLLYFVFYDKGKTRHKSKPPFGLTFPKREHEVQGSPDFDEWTRQLQQREEGNHRILDIASSVKATIVTGGFPMITYKRSKRRPHYLILLDSRSPFDQKTRVYEHVSSMLYQSGIDVDLFYFHTSPDYCWNQRYPQGIKTETLQLRFPESYLLLITEGVRLVDYDNGDVAAWVTKLFSSWSKRAVLTPVSPDQWGFIEKILAKFFVVLPATPSGQFLLRPFLDDEAPSFTRLKNLFGRNLSIPPKILDNNLDRLSVEDIEKYLTVECRREDVDRSFRDLMIQWAFATAVYTRPTFEITVAIGKALEEKRQTYGLVTTAHLLLITSLPWLKQERLPYVLRDKLLDRLRKDDKELEKDNKTEQIAREAVIAALQSSKPEPGSRASEEKEIRYWEQVLHSNQKGHSTLRAIGKLRSFQRAGLVFDKQVTSKVQGHYNLFKWIFASFLAIALAALTSYLPLRQIPITRASTFFFDQQGSVDSAAYYNNLAVDFSERISSYQQSGEFDDQFTSYDSVIKYLDWSWRYREEIETCKNLFRLKYNLTLNLFLNDQFRDSASTSYRDYLADIPAIMAPLHEIEPGWVPERKVLKSYLEFVRDSASGPDYSNSSLLEQRIRQFQFRLMGSSIAKKQPTRGGFARLITIAADSLKKDNIRLESTQYYLTQYYFMRALQNNTDFKSLMDFILDITIDRIYLFYNGPQPKKDRQDRTDEGISGGAGSRSGGRGSGGAGSRSDPPVVSTPAITDTTKIDTASILPVPGPVRDTTVTQDDEITPKAGTIPGTYGVVKGRLRKLSWTNVLTIDVDDGNNNDYAVVIGASRINTGKGREQAAAIIVNTLPGAFYIVSKFSDGFTRLNKNQSSGALNYVIEEDKLAGGQQVAIEGLYNYLMKFRGIKKAKIYVWGSRSPVPVRIPDKLGDKSGANLGDKSGESWRINYVQLNQGSTLPPEYPAQNAPWQDGAVLFELPDTKESIIVYILFPSQVLTVDENGQPEVINVK